MHYSVITFLYTVVDRFILWDFSCLCLAEHESRRWWFAPFLGEVSHHETARSVFYVHQCSLVSSTRGLVGRFILIHLPKCLCILFELGLSWAVAVSSIMDLLSTVVESDVIHISCGYLLLIFSIASVVPSFTTLQKHELVAEPVGLRIFIRVIIGLIV